MTYTYLNLVFMGISLLAVLWLRRRAKLSIRVVTVAMLFLLLLTTISDNFIVASGIVDYTESQILGVRIGAAPVEDFAYAIVAAVLLPALWQYLGRSKK